MASGSVGANEDSDLRAPQRPRLGEFTKVYTRKFRRRAQLDRHGEDPATTATDAAEPPLAVASTNAERTFSASPAKSPTCNDDDVAQQSQQETLAAKDGNFSPQLGEKQPQPAASLAEVESSGSDLRLSEEGRDGREDVQKGGQEWLPPSGQEASLGVQRCDGQETVPNVEEEPARSSGKQASPQPQAPDGQEPVSEFRELPLSGSNQTFADLQTSTGEQPVPDGREDLPSSGGQEPVSNAGEVPEPTGTQEVTSNREGNLQPNGVEATTSNSVEERQVLPNGRDEPQLIGDEVSQSIEHERPMNDGAAAALVNGGSKPVVSRVEDRIRFNLSESMSKDVIRGVKRKLVGELDQVRSLVRKLEDKEFQFTGYNTSNTNNNASYVGGFGSFGAYSQPQLMRVHSDVGSVGRPQLMRVNSEVGSVGRQEIRPFRHLTVSVMGNNHGIRGFVEKEKRTPKANQYYRNSEFLLGKDRLPPENNKRLKPNGAGKKHGGEAEYGFGFGIGVDKNRDKVFRNCSSLLQRLMKHKHGWVFNEPVDAEKLCIPDYHDIIKHPMDFGTIKTRLSQNLYKFPREFAEDVRLVFRNAMTYNPQGQDVHVMAEELSNIFEERWAVIEKEYFPYQMYYDAGLPIPTPRRAPPPLPTPVLSPVPALPRSAPPMRTLDRSESMTTPVDSRLKPNFPPPIRTPVPKKPKAKDPNKRDMTYEEKQKLSTNLQSLPTEKLDAIVQIIKKRNTALSQHDDEIEVDIDSVDAETLWELDRFVTNYKKSLSKNKRKAELALQARAEAAQAVPVMNTAPAAMSTQKESGVGANTNPSAIEVEKQGDNVSASSSSSSSSSDSGSSTSDSDSDSSSAYGSDAGRSPRS